MPETIKEQKVEQLGGPSSVLARPRRDHAEVRSGRSEDTGGKPDPEAADRHSTTGTTHSTTGTTPNDVFVGRVAGDDPGYLETGADKRAAPDTGEGDETTTST